MQQKAAETVNNVWFTYDAVEAHSGVELKFFNEQTTTVDNI